MRRIHSLQIFGALWIVSFCAVGIDRGNPEQETIVETSLTVLDRPFCGRLSFLFAFMVSLWKSCFSFASKIFNTPFGHGVTSVGAVSSNLSDFISGQGRGVIDFLMLPLSLTRNPNAFGGDKIGLVFLVLMPVVIFVLIRRWRWALFLLFYTVIWFSLSQYVRYLIPVLSGVAILIGFGLNHLESKFKGALRKLLLILVGILTFQAVWSGYHTYKDFMMREADSIVEVADWLNEVITDPTTKVLVIGDPLLYYYNFRAFREKSFRNFTSYPEMDVDDVLKLMDKEEIENVVVARPLVRSGIEGSLDLFNAFDYFDGLVSLEHYQILSEYKTREGKTYELYTRKR